jgi:type II secretory pathway pseudopilin PulG
MPHARRHLAFTLMELIVAISIAGLMILMINVLFQESVRAVNLGAGTSRVLQQAHTINTQLEKDFGVGASQVLLRNSLPDGPGEDRDAPSVNATSNPDRVGFLLIAHHLIQNPAGNTAMTYPVPDDIDEDNEVYLLSGERANPFFPDDTDGDGDADLRSDQLLLMRNVYPGERPITPQAEDALGNDNAVGAALIWYGHVQPTNDLGTDADDDPTNADYWFYNHPANQWVLGRQARYFSADLLAANASNDPVFNPSDDIRANFTRTGGDVDRGLSDGSVIQTSTSSPSPSIAFEDLAATDGAVLNDPSPIASPRVFHALTDLIPASAHELFEDMSNSTPNGPVIGIAGPLGAGNSDVEYRVRATNLAYLNDRLWVNARPHDASGNPARLLESWQQAQMHPYLASGVSEFEVHFAGDYTLDATEPDFDGRIDLDGDGNIVWYNSVDPATGNLIVPATKGSIGADADEVPLQNTTAFDHANIVTFIFRHDQPQSWPDLIRVRYRIHDERGRISDRQLDTDNDGVPDTNQAVPGRTIDIILRVPG